MKETTRPNPNNIRRDTRYKRIIKLVPEVPGVYGPRVWVSSTDHDMNVILTVLSVWPGPTNTSGANFDYEHCWELPFGFTETPIWKSLISRMQILIKEG